jgi:hypothetical protein
VGRNRRTQAGWAFYAVLARSLAVLAFAIQCFVVDPHVDGLAFHSADAAVSTSISSSEHAGKQAPATCIICQEAAISRTAMLDGAPPIRIVEHSLYLSSAPPRAPLLETRPSRPWQSRAPPSFA